MAPRRTRLLATLAYYALFVGLGLTTGILGPTLPDLSRQTGSDLGSMGALFLLGSAGYTAGTVLGGRLFDRVRGHLLLGTAELLAAASVGLFPAAHRLGFLLCLAFSRGMAEGVINAGGNTLLLWMHGEKASPFVNGLHFCFGLGAFVSPLLVAKLVGVPGGFRFAYLGVAAFGVLAGMWILFLPGSPDPPEHAPPPPGRGPVRRGAPYGAIALGALYLFAYVGGEISFGSWIYSYAMALGVVAPAAAAVLTSAFWLSFTVGRATSVPVALRFAPRQVIPVALAACLFLSALLVGLPSSAGLLWAAAVGLGFCMAPLWPSGYTLAGQAVPMTAFASGLVLLGDSLGGMVLPSLTGKVMELAGSDHLSLSLPLLVFGTLLLCLFAFLGLRAAARGRPGA
ncbi:MAG TPA: MFS transporter [Anaeromyxobacter sp.]|nr:MFS transporter [Anaeromyxobacter sp.]